MEPREFLPERRRLTVMMVDLVGSTSLSETLDPEDVGAILQAYRQLCEEVVRRFSGDIVNIVGDAVTACFGWPLAHEDDAERAVRAGLAILAGLSRLETPVDVPVQARIGTATGLVVVREASSGAGIKVGELIGVAPNLAARLQSHARPGGMLISESTAGLIKGRFELRPVGPLAIKGLSKDVEAFRVERESAAESRFVARSTARRLAIVGREEQLAQLRQHWADASAGRGRMTILMGEGGIGKSRLAQALLDDIGTDGVTRLVYQCSPFHTGTPLHPIIQTMRRAWGLEASEAGSEIGERLAQALDRHGLTDTADRALIAMMLHVADGADAADRTRDSAQQIRRRTLDLLTRDLVRMARQRPVVALLEDAHWIDPTTLALMQQALAAISSERLLAVVTARPSFLEHVPASAEVIRLQPLLRPAVIDLMRQIAREKSMPRVILETVARRTDGVPLYIEELTRSLLESDVLIETEHGFSLKGAIDDLDIPLSLNDLLNARLDRAHAARETVQTAACIGREFSWDLLAATMQRDEQRLRTELDILLAAQLIREQGDDQGGRYVFRHSLIQQAAYDMILKTTRAATHRKIADALPLLRPGYRDTHPEDMARHLLAAERPVEALPLYEIAGAKAAARSAHIEAVRHFEQCLRLTDHVPAAEDRRATRLRLLMALGPSLMALRGYADEAVAATYREALVLLDGLDADAPEQIPVLFGLWSYAVVRNHLREALDVGERLFGIASAIDDEDLLLEAHVLLGVTHFTRGTVVEARHHCETALRLYHPERHRRHAAIYGQEPGMAATTFLAISLWWLGEEVQALQRADEALDLAERSEHPFSLAFCLSILARMHMLRGDAAAALRFAERAEHLSEQQLFPVWGATAAIVGGWARHQQQSDAALGLAQMRAGLDAYAQIGSGLSAPLYRALLLDQECTSLEPGEALARIRAIREDATRSEGLGDIAEIMRIEARCLERAGDRDGARRALRAALERANAMQSRAWAVRIALDLGHLLTLDDREEDAIALVRACAAEVDTVEDSPFLSEAVKQFIGSPSHFA
ncbi:MAG: AAA family ATPase [Alphaproteobacteria bacterium]